MNLLKAILSLGLALNVTPVLAADQDTSAPDYLEAMCTLTGNWSGKFEQYNEIGVFRTSGFDAGFLCLPDKDVLMETNVFLPEDGESFSTLKVIFPTKQVNEMQMAYFYGGMEKAFFFKSARLDYDDAEHWTVVRESAGKAHEAGKETSASRYIHIRSGNELTMIREVKPDDSSDEWKLSSKLILQWQP